MGMGKEMTKEESKSYIRNYFDYLLNNSSAERPMWNLEMVRSNRPNKWNYIDGCMIKAILQMYEHTGEERYFDFAKRFVDYFVKEDGSIETYRVEELNIDNINAGKNLFKLYEKTGDEKYKKALDLIRSQIDEMPRTKAGNFWHKLIYPNQVWLDGLYMAQPFYMEYETKFRGMSGCMDSIKQYENVEKLMRDEKTGLYYHGYDESREMYWADPETGCSPNFWIRALGWFAASLVDTASVMDESLYYEYRYLQDVLKNLVDSLLPYQDESGMFYQVIDHKEAEGNYLETSGTALIAYAILSGVRLGYLPQNYREYGEKAFWGIVDQYLEVTGPNELHLGGICLVAGLGGKDHRDGSLAYYFSEPVVSDDAKGVAPFFLAFTEILMAEK